MRHDALGTAAPSSNDSSHQEPLLSILRDTYPIQFPKVDRSTLKTMHCQVAFWNRLTGATNVDQIDRTSLTNFNDNCLNERVPTITINAIVRTVIQLAQIAGFDPLSSKPAKRKGIASSPIPEPKELQSC